MNRTHRLCFVMFLTFARVPLVLLFAAGAIVHSVRGNAPAWLFFASLACLAAAALTDLFDGYCARKLEVTTRLGAYIDPLTDKIFYLTTLPLLVFLAAKNDHITHAIVLLCFTLLFLIRDQWVSFLRSVGSIYDADVSANWSGKVRTVVNFPLICAIYCFEGYGGAAANMALLYVFEAVGFLLNLISIYIYTHRYWPYLRKSATS